MENQECQHVGLNNNTIIDTVNNINITDKEVINSAEIMSEMNTFVDSAVNIDLAQGMTENAVNITENVLETNDVVDGVSVYLDQIKESYVSPVINRAKEFTDSNLNKIIPDYSEKREKISTSISECNNYIIKKNENLMLTVENKFTSLINQPYEFMFNLLTSKDLFRFLIVFLFISLIITILCYMNNEAKVGGGCKCFLFASNFLCLCLAFSILLFIDESYHQEMSFLGITFSPFGLLIAYTVNFVAQFFYLV